MDKLVHRRNEEPLTEYLYAKAVKNRIPLNGTFELSPVCNMKCRMCYIRKSPDEVAHSKRSIMRLDEWLALARQMKEAGTLFLLLTGGETFLWPDFWKLYEQLQHMGFRISINTNGTLIDETVVERLKKMAPAKLNITLYGASDKTYESLCGAKGMYSRVTQAIDKLTEAGIPVRINASLTPYNVDDLEKIMDFGKKRDIPVQATAYMFPPLRNHEDSVGRNEARFTPQEAARVQMRIYRLQTDGKSWRVYLENVLKGQGKPLGLEEDCMDPDTGRVRCRAGKASFWVTWDGYMTMCGMITNFKSDIRQNSFTEAWKQVVADTDKLRLSGTCAKCPVQRVCHSCAAMALTETGKIDGVPKYLCDMVAEMQKIAEDELKYDSVR